MVDAVLRYSVVALSLRFRSSNHLAAQSSVKPQTVASRSSNWTCLRIMKHCLRLAARWRLSDLPPVAYPASKRSNSFCNEL